MGQFSLADVDLQSLKPIQDTVEKNSAELDFMIKDIIYPYCKDLDRYVTFIRDCLKDGETPPTNEELDDFCMNLSTLIYFAGGYCEQLGVRDDISKSIYKETYHTARSAQDFGTVADKDSAAELQSQKEQVLNICYSRAYREMKSKIEAAQELLASCKKVLTRRCQEFELTNMQR